MLKYRRSSNKESYLKLITKSFKGCGSIRVVCCWIQIRSCAMKCSMIIIELLKVAIPVIIIAPCKEFDGLSGGGNEGDNEEACEIM